MKIKEITIGLVDSIRLSNYQYAKPELRLVIELIPGVSADKQIEEAEAYILREIDKFKKKIIDQRS